MKITDVRALTGLDCPAHCPTDRPLEWRRYPGGFEGWGVKNVVWTVVIIFTHINCSSGVSSTSGWQRMSFKFFFLIQSCAKSYFSTSVIRCYTKTADTALLEPLFEVSTLVCFFSWIPLTHWNVVCWNPVHETNNDFMVYVNHYVP